MENQSLPIAKPITPDSIDVPVRVPDHVVHRPFPTETVVLNLQTGKYHGLNPVAGRMLEALEARGSVQAAAPEIAIEYGQDIGCVERDLHHLCRDLIERGLIEVDPGQ